ncbi:hypothetical protein O6B72_03625 [Campylobacter ureolyticus]|uniref:tyrosine-type recombinase/integrase n=1 Tax=Campylobacter ureolyticus TaxID=827 RepID=UPI0022B3F842|nr:hypothetical protein [Campylobacter ureolyticus]MCZ6155902.1 hypothetical protein [Campylobacter ureolyticus]
MNKLCNSYIIRMPYSDKLECLGDGIYVKQVKRKVPYLSILTTEIEKKLIYRKKIGGKLKQCVLGIYPTIKIEDAIRKSIEIGQEWQNQENAPRSYTFSDLFIAMLKEKGYNVKPNTVENYEKRFRTKAFDSLRNKPIDQIEVSDIWKVLDSYSNKYESKKKVRTIISEVFKYAQKRGLVKENITPNLSEISGKKAEYHSYLDPRFPESLISYLKFIETIEKENIRTALLLNLLVPLRAANLLLISADRLVTVDDIPCLYIEAERMKGGKAGEMSNTYPISSEIYDFIEKIGKINFTSSTNLNRYIRKFKHDKIIGAKPYMTLHSARSIFASHVQFYGGDIVGSENLLSHSGVAGASSVAKHYYRSTPYKRGHKVAEWWFSYIKDICIKNNINLFDIFEGADDD